MIDPAEAALAGRLFGAWMVPTFGLEISPELAEK
jgi:hypothetical protein